MKFDYQIKHRKGSDNTKEQNSCDFTINNDSLLETIIKLDGGHDDFIGCFAKEWTLLNKHSRTQLLLKEEAETESGRSLLYLCPECADIGCGAYGCKIVKINNQYIWSDFAYENGYEEPKLIQNLGPFIFEAYDYEILIDKLSLL